MCFAARVDFRQKVGECACARQWKCTLHGEAQAVAAPEVLLSLGWKQKSVVDALLGTRHSRPPATASIERAAASIFKICSAIPIVMSGSPTIRSQIWRMSELNDSRSARGMTV